MERDKEKEGHIKTKQWAKGLSWRAIAVLANEEIDSEDKFMKYDPGLKISWNTKNEILRRAFELKLEKGLIDESKPLQDDETHEIISRGGLYFVGDSPAFSLGKVRGAKSDLFLSVEGGAIRYKYLHAEGYTAFSGFRCYPMSKINKRFGVVERKGFDDWEPRADLTRQVFGATFSDLTDILKVYSGAFYGEYFLDNFARVTCSLRKNRCSLSGAYIPDNFPFIVFGDTQNWPSHISLSAFYDHLGLITGNFGEGQKAIDYLKEHGLIDEHLNMLKKSGLGGYGLVSFEEIEALK